MLTLLLAVAALPCVLSLPLQAGAGHSLSAVQRWSVWFMSLISAGIAVASVVVNDYFDLKLDTTNAPDKPLPSGKRLAVAVAGEYCLTFGRRHCGSAGILSATFSPTAPFLVPAAEQ